MDILTQEQRRKAMSKVRRKDTPPELMVRKFLFAKGFRFRKNDAGLPGSPDIVLPRYKIVIFIHGCFWHGHSCKGGGLPKSNTEFWKKKIKGNKNRDRRKNYQLKEMGWRILKVWQCSLQNRTKASRRLDKLLGEINLMTINRYE